MKKVRIHILSEINNPSFEPPLNQIADDLLIVSYLNQMIFVYIPVNNFSLITKDICGHPINILFHRGTRYQCNLIRRVHLGANDLLSNYDQGSALERQPGPLGR
jgi:hypothetical protein